MGHASTRPHGVALVLIYPCGKAQNRPPRSRRNPAVAAGERSCVVGSSVGVTRCSGSAAGAIAATPTEGIRQIGAILHAKAVSATVVKPFGFATGDGEGSRCGIRTRIALQNPVAQVVVAILWGHGPFAIPGQGGMLLRGAMPEISAGATAKGREPQTSAKRRGAAGPPRPPKSLPEAPQGRGLGCANLFKKRTRHLSLVDIKGLTYCPRESKSKTYPSWAFKVLEGGLRTHTICVVRATPPLGHYLCSSWFTLPFPANHVLDSAPRDLEGSR